MQEMTAQKAYKYLEEILIKAENEIRRMPVRKEVVFLPLLFQVPAEKTFRHTGRTVPAVIRIMDINGVGSSLLKRILFIVSNLDRIRRMDKEAVELPETWRRIIEKPDGTWKKVILYNTGIGQFLQSTSQMLVKIRAVLTHFLGLHDHLIRVDDPGLETEVLH